MFTETFFFFFCRVLRNGFPVSDVEVLISGHFTAQKALSIGNSDARNTAIPAQSFDVSDSMRHLNDQ